MFCLLISSQSAYAQNDFSAYAQGWNVTNGQWKAAPPPAGPTANAACIAAGFSCGAQGNICYTSWANDPGGCTRQTATTMYYKLVTCPDTFVFDYEMGECVPPDEPPPVCDGYPEGWEEITLSYNGIVTTDCFPNFQDQEQEDCAAPVGTITFGGETTIICDDHRNECTANNGTYGSYNGMETCLPEDFGDDIPTCDADGHVSMVWDPVAQSGGVVCESPVEPIPDAPGQEDTEVPDDDDDGNPNNNDDDIDGDGIPNSSDPDRDGDGIPNEDDPTPDGDQDKEDSSVSGGKICNSAPQCKGDAIQCAILYQAWKNRCSKTDEVDENLNPGDIDEGDQLTSIIDDGLATITGTGDQGIDDELNTFSTLVTGLFPAQASCTDPVINFFGNQFTISCQRLGDVRDIIGWFFYLLTALYLFELVTTPTKSKV